tara:strand:- start:2694 stop:3047 length:354 start_codon:yes stop_codon:yes gene_type:complete
MSDLIDNPKFFKPSNKVRIINVLFILMIISLLIITILKVWMDNRLIVSDFTPKYTVFLINGVLINFSLIEFSSLIPALYLTYKKKYLISTIVIILFLLIGFVLKDQLELYKFFYPSV